MIKYIFTYIYMCVHEIIKNKDLSIASGKEIVFQIQQSDVKNLLSYARTNS